MSSLTKEEICHQLSTLYGWKLDELLRRNEAQLLTLYTACLDEDGKLRTTDSSKK